MVSDYLRCAGVVNQIATPPLGVTFHDDEPHRDSRRLGDTARCAPVSVNLVFDDDGRLVCVFADSEGEWALPEDGLLQPLASVARDPLGWTFGGPVHGVLKSTIPEVLGEVWAVFGVDPSAARFIAIRPRLVGFSHPGADTTLDAEPSEAELTARWIVEVRGSVVQVRNGYPYTGLLAAATDGNPQQLQGTTLRRVQVELPHRLGRAHWSPNRPGVGVNHRRRSSSTPFRPGPS